VRLSCPLVPKGASSQLYVSKAVIEIREAKSLSSIALLFVSKGM